jgi:hypothetical protein
MGQDVSNRQADTIRSDAVADTRTLEDAMSLDLEGETDAGAPQ